MPLLTNHDQNTKATGTALTYITIGAILSVLAGTSFFFFTQPFEDNKVLGYVRVTVLLIGLVLFLIGLAVGQISRVAAKNEATAEEEALAGTKRQAQNEAQRSAG